MTGQAKEPTDHGEIVARRRPRISWAWLFPVLASIAAGWMFWSNWKEQGPEITIEFGAAPGIRPGKTLLIYRGVVAGTVSNIALDAKLNKVLVHVRLKAFAAGIAREGTVFWIDQPVISLSQTSGIESLIDGNSIQTVMGTGPPATLFPGSDIMPVTAPGKSYVSIKLRGSLLPFLDRGTPVYFRGITVGVVRAKALNEQNEAFLDVLIEGQYADILRSKARFWILPTTSVKIGPGILKLDFAGLKTLLFGGVAFDFFGEQGDPVKDGAAFDLCANEAAARANSSPLVLEFKDGQGILPGETQLRYMGIPVGLVEKISPGDGCIVVTARLQPGYESLRRKGSIFSVIRPSISLQKVYGLEALISGIYIDCIPGPKGPTVDRFSGTSQEDAILFEYDEDGFQVVLQSASTKILPGTSVIYRGMRVGKIIRKALSPDGRSVKLTASIQQKYAALLRENTRFWNESGLKISGGLISLNVQSSALESRAFAGVEFATPEGTAMGAPVKPGHVYELNDSPRKEWLQWLPDIPLNR